MAQILIRRLDQHVVRKLRAKAAAEGVSAEEEARRILRRSLVGDVPSMPLIDFLRTMPDVDDDSMFRRRKRKPRNVALEWFPARYQCRVRAAKERAVRPESKC